MPLCQITDIEIDKINKPYLPIPAGTLSRAAAKLTISLCLLVGVVLGVMPSALGSPALSVRDDEEMMGLLLIPS